MITKVLLYTAGAIAGGWIGMKIADYVLFKTEYSEVVEEAEEHMEEVRERIETPEPPVESIETPEKPKKKKKDKTSPVDYNGIHKPNPYVQKARLSELAKKYQGEDEEEPVDLNGPHVISFEDYLDSNGQEKVHLTYYEGDDTLSGPDDDIIEDAERVVGDALVKFGTRSDDPETVYVRSRKEGKDYEITRVSGSYSKNVLGLDEELERPKRKRRKMDARSEEE